MTDKEKLEKVKDTIERHYNYHKDHADDWAGTEHFWKTDEDRELLSFIDSMQKELVSEDLEEAIGEYCSNPENFITYIDVGFKQSPIKKDDIPLIIKAIKFGANWQKQQDKLRKLS